MYGNDTQMSECEVYKVEQSKSVTRFVFEPNIVMYKKFQSF